MAVILDAFSRKVVGWALERSLAAQLAVVALQHAISSGARRRALYIIQIAEYSMRPASMERCSISIKSLPA